MHEMHLHNEPFTKIKDGTKTIEIRLNDEKRQIMKVNDKIKFTNRVTKEEMMTTIIGLHYYDSFSSLYKDFDKVSLGYQSDEEAKPEDMEIYYSKEDQAKYGVVAIELKKD